MLSILLGCSFRSNGIKSEGSSESDFLEVSDSESENLEKIKSTKLKFKLQYDQDILAWERLAFFFNFYLKSPTKITKHQTEVKVMTSDKLLYIINRKNLDNLIQYRVTVLDSNTKKSTKKSIIKAKNLSRFLSEGVLDQNLL